MGPCVCDLSDYIRVDAKTLTTRDGQQTLNVLVLGDPCDKPWELDVEYEDPFSHQPETLKQSAPELVCDTSNKLKGAIYSDHGFPIVGLFFTDKSDIDAVRGPKPFSAKDPTFGFGEMCVMREKRGYNSGMGLIFHQMARISPIPNSPALPMPTASPELEKSLLQEVEMPHKFALPSISNPMRGTIVNQAAVGFFLVLLVSMAFVLWRRLVSANAIPKQAKESESPECFE